ncbi:MAG TPA: AEC family transporter [Jiangellaceae bacterium]
MDAVLEIVPLVVVFAASYAVKRAGLLTADDGGALLRVVFYLGVPPLIFMSLASVELDASFLRLGLVAPVVIGFSLLVVLVLRRTALKGVDAAAFGPFLTGVVVMNTGFLLPFVERIAGAEGIARLAVIDAFVGIMTFSVVYLAVVRVAHDRPDTAFLVKKLLISPPMWALVAALLVQLVGVTPPVVITESLEVAARIVGTAVLIALGLKFEPHIRRPGLLTLAVGLRFGLGAVVGMGLIAALGLEGIDAGVAMFACLAPTGFNAITFAELEKLDVQFAAAVVSAGLLIAVAASPLTTQLLR